MGPCGAPRAPLHDFQRKEAVVNEANAIGTAFLRADLAAEPGRTELRQRLLDYARTRLVTAENTTIRAETLQFVARSLAAQAKLWPATKKALGRVTLPVGE